MTMKKYLSNCFLLFIPILLWNILLVDYLPVGFHPDNFDKDIPPLIKYGEIILRLVVFVLPVVMLFSIKTKWQKVGLFIYLLGLVVYFLSWTLLILRPESNWSHSLLGFMAPAYTTILFLVGIGLIGRKAFFKIRHLSLIYNIFSFLFVMVHSAHVYIVYVRLNA